MDKLLIEQTRIVGAIVSTPFHSSIMALIGPALLDIRQRGRELISIPPQRRQSTDFRDAVREFDVAVEGYCAALDAFDGRERGGAEMQEDDLQRAFALRRALKSMAGYAAVLIQEASTVELDR